MVQLNDEQVDVVHHRIVSDEVISTDLQNSLLDHYCCFIENLMSAGADFELAYQQAFVAITPNGAQEIQHELDLILTLKQITSMKRTIYGFGFLATFCLSTGLMFRSMHWPGAPALTLAGFVFLIVTSAALVYNIVQQKGVHKLSYKIRVALGFVAIVLISTGSIFKAFNFPYANIQLIAGMALLNFLFLPMFFYYLYKQALQSSLGKQS